MMERKDYELAGRKFYQFPIMVGQARLLLAKFQGVPLFKLTLSDVLGLIGGQVTSLMAIVLIEEGQTLAEKMKRGEAGLQELQDWLDVSVQPEELAPAVTDFFVFGQLRRALSLLPQAEPPAPPAS